jgi:hypothetical protein
MRVYDLFFWKGSNRPKRLRRHSFDRTMRRRMAIYVSRRSLERRLEAFATDSGSLRKRLLMTRSSARRF